MWSLFYRVFTTSVSQLSQLWTNTPFYFIRMSYSCISLDSKGFQILQQALQEWGLSATPLLLPHPLRISTDTPALWEQGNSTAEVILFLADDFLGSKNKTGIFLDTNVRSLTYYFEGHLQSIDGIMKLKSCNFWDLYLIFEIVHIVLINYFFLFSPQNLRRSKFKQVIEWNLNWDH